MSFTTSLQPQTVSETPSLQVFDERTKRTYRMPIRNNAVRATDFAKISSGTVESPKGLTIIDPGYRNTAVLESSITQLNDAEGTISFRGHNLDNLFTTCDFEEVAHLLIWGHLPTPDEKTHFVTAIAQAMNPPSLVFEVIKAFPKTAPTVTILTAALSAWNSNLPDAMPISTGKLLYTADQKAAIDNGIIQTLGANIASIALVSCHRRGVPFHLPAQGESISYNLLLMGNIVDTRTGKPKCEQVELISKLMILYADHEMTNSTAAFLHVASTLADPISCLISALQSGHGPLHAGAMVMAHKQFASIGNPRNVRSFLQRAKREKKRIFGYGNRVWRTCDPRHKHMKTLLDDEVVSPLVDGDVALSVAMEIDRQTSQDEYFIRNRIQPNVDLLGCFIFCALGFDQDSTVALASVARVAGILSHWKEQLEQPISIWRPRIIFVDPNSSPNSNESKFRDSPSSPLGPVRARL